MKGATTLTGGRRPATNPAWARRWVFSSLLGAGVVASLLATGCADLSLGDPSGAENAASSSAAVRHPHGQGGDTPLFDLHDPIRAPRRAGGVGG
jgi:hypothetical protein